MLNYQRVILGGWCRWHWVNPTLNPTSSGLPQIFMGQNSWNTAFIGDQLHQCPMSQLKRYSNSRAPSRNFPKGFPPTSVSPKARSKPPTLMGVLTSTIYNSGGHFTGLKPVPWYIYTNIYIYTLWLFNIAMGNDPFIDGLPIKNGWIFPWLC